MANPRTSRARSADPVLPATVEKRTNTGVFSPFVNTAGPADAGQRAVALEVPVRPEPAGVDDPLGDALVVEVEDLLAEVEVLQQRRPARPDPQRVLVVGDRHALLGGQRERAVGRLVRLAAGPGGGGNRAGFLVGGVYRPGGRICPRGRRPRGLVGGCRRLRPLYREEPGTGGAGGGEELATRRICSGRLVSHERALRYIWIERQSERPAL